MLRWLRNSGYPLTLQILVALLLAALPIGAISDLAALGQPLGIWQLLGCAFLAAGLLVMFLSVPITRMPVWGKLGCLIAQCVLIALEQLLLPSQIIGYLFLGVVMQAVYLFGVWIWIPLLGLVWLIWGGAALVIAHSWLDWLRANVYAVLLMTTIALAVAVYTSQHRLRQQAEHLARRLQEQYNSLLARFEQTPQQSVLEERQRILSTVETDLQSALRRLELLVGNVISQAHISLSQSQQLLGQAQRTSRETIDKVRAVLSTLRPGIPTIPPIEPALLAAQVPADQTLLAWGGVRVLPLIFFLLSPLLALIERPETITLLWQGLLFALVLLACWLFANAQLRLRGPWFPLGVIGQIGVLISFVLTTHAVSLLIGMALVAMQIAMRYDWTRLTLWFVALQGMTALVVAILQPAIWQVIGSLLLIGLVSAAAIFPIMSARRRLIQRDDSQRLLESLSAQVADLYQQQESLRQLAIVTERRRVAREIHDTLGHCLVTIDIQTRVAEELLSSNPQAALEQLRELQHLVAETRNSLNRTLTDAIPDLGGMLHASLQRLVARANLRPEWRVDLSADGVIDSLPPDIALILYRAAQEGLTNAEKHSTANHVQVLVERFPSQVRLIMRDNGKLREIPASNSGGFGLRGLHERATLVGGFCEHYRNEDGGFVLHVEIPLAGG